MSFSNVGCWKEALSGVKLSVDLAVVGECLTMRWPDVPLNLAGKAGREVRQQGQHVGNDAGVPECVDAQKGVISSFAREWCIRRSILLPTFCLVVSPSTWTSPRKTAAFLATFLNAPTILFLPVDATLSFAPVVDPSWLSSSSESTWLASPPASTLCWFEFSALYPSAPISSPSNPPDWTASRMWSAVGGRGGSGKGV